MVSSWGRIDGWARVHPSSTGVSVRCGLLLMVAAGCSAGEAVIPGISSEMPSLLEVATPTGQPGLSTRSAIALGPDGAWLFASPGQTDGAVVLVTEASPVGIPIGGVGEGPGEARMPFPLIVDSSHVGVFDMAAARFTTWNREGALVASQWLEPSVIPFLAMPDGRLLGGRGSARGRVPMIIDPVTAKTATAIEPSDSLYLALLADTRSSDPGVSDLPAVLGFWAGGVVVGDGKRFTFGLFDDRGEGVAVARLDLPPRYLAGAALDRELDRLQSAGIVRRDPSARDRAQQRLAAEQLPWVSHLSPPRSDAAGRLWIVRSGGTDSVVAELFAGSRHLGSLPFGCPDFGGEWALADGWFALVCGPSDAASDQDAVVRRYRIQDRVRPRS